MIILCIGYRDWGYAESNGINVRDLHLATNLSEHEDVEMVLYLSRPNSLAEKIFFRKNDDLQRSTRIASGRHWKLYKNSDHDKLYMLNVSLNDFLKPLVYRRLWWDKSLKDTRTVTAVDAALQFLNRNVDVLLNWTPFAPSVSGLTEHKVYTFDVIDNFAKHARITAKKEITFAKEAYKKIGQEAKLVTSVSRDALEVFGDSSSARKIVIGNGVNSEWLRLSPVIPEALRKIKRPIVGTGGMFFRKFDTELLLEVADKLKDVQFVLIGKLLDKKLKKAIKTRNNIHFLGYVGYNDLASYYYHFDAAFMMYIPTLENDGDPLKLYEFLAVGTPVVSTPSMGVERHAEGVFVARNSEEFSIKLRDVLSRSRSRYRDSCRRQIAEDDTWAVKSSLMVNLFKEYI